MSVAENRQLILERLAELPPLHQVAQKLITMMNDDLSSAGDLERLIRTDQALTARVLKIANSASYGKSREVFKITEAVVLLGHTALTNMVLSISVGDIIGNKVNDTFANRAWIHSLDCAAIAQALAEVTGLVPPESAFVAGLLHDIGLLVQSQALPDVVRAVISRGSNDPLAIERETMGLNHPQVGLKLLDKWCLPAPLCEAVRFHHTPKRKFLRTNPLVSIVALADQLARIEGHGPYPNLPRADFFQQLSLMGIDAPSFEELFQAMQRNSESVRRLQAGETGGATREPNARTELAAIGPIGFHAPNAKRHLWYRSVLQFMAVPLATDPQGPLPTHVVVNFHGATPAERDDVCRAIHTHGLTPVVIGDRRHTPDSKILQSAPHLPELFTLEELVTQLQAVHNGTAVESIT